MPSNGPIYPSSSANWTNSSNANAADSVGATATTTRTFNAGDGGYDIVPTPNLLCASFSGLGSGMAAGDTVLGITVEINVKSTGGTSTIGKLWLANGGTQVGSVQDVALSVGYNVVTLGGASDTLGGAWTGATVPNLQVVFFARRSTGTGSATIDVDYIRVTVTYAASTPSAFTFNDVTGAALATTYTSNAISVAGLGAGVSVPVSVVSGSYMKNSSGVWTSSAGTAQNGDTFAVRLSSSFLPSTHVGCVLTIGGVSDTFDVTTASGDSTPDAFSFGAQGGVEPSATCTSNAIVVSGITIGSAITVSGGLYSINGAAFTSAAGTVVNGDSVRARVTASGSYATSATATVTIGGVGGAFVAVTRSADTTPAAFSFTDVTAASTSTVYTSNAITVSGIEAAAALSFATSGGSSHEYQINGGSWTAVGTTTISNGDTLKVRMTSPGSANQVGNITVTIGGVSDTYSVSTGADTTPNAFSFTSVTNAQPGAVQTSGAVVLAGMTPATAVTATVSAGAELRVGAGSWVTTADVVNGDSITVRQAASLQAGATVVVTLTVETVSGTFSITTAMAGMAPDF